MIAPCVAARNGARKEESPFTGGSLNVHASCLLERVDAREDCLVPNLPTLQAKDPQEEVVVHRSETGDGLRTDDYFHSNPTLQYSTSTGACRGPLLVIVG